MINHSECVMTLFTNILDDETVKHVHTKIINFEAIGPREKPRSSPLGCPKHDKTQCECMIELSTGIPGRRKSEGRPYQHHYF